MTHFQSAPVLLASETTPRPRLGRLSRLSRRRGAPWIGVAILVSLLIHAVAFGLFAAAGRRPTALPTKAAQVELLMVEQKGTKASNVTPTPPQRAKAPPAKAPPAKPAAAKPPPESPKPQQAKKTDTPVPPEAPKPKQVAAAPTPPVPEVKPTDTPASQPTQAARGDKATQAAEATPSTQKGPKIDFSGTGAESDAEVFGGHVLPASPDNRYRNMPPPYSAAAAERGEHGDVTVLIHVGADGFATGAEVVESSGYPSLDASTLAAVRKWHFHPALRDGKAVPFDFPFRFEFRRRWTDKLGP